MALDPAKIKVTTSYKYEGTFYALGVAAVGGRVYAGGDDHAVHVFDPAKKEPLARWGKHTNYVSALVCVNRPSKQLVISGSYDRVLIWWDAASGQSVRSAQAHAGWVRDLVATPDGTRLISVGDDMSVKIWETDTGRLVRTLDGHAPRTPQGHVSALYAVAVSPDARYAASGDRAGQVCVWELDTGKQIQQLAVPVLYTYDGRQRKRSIGGIRALAFSRDGSALAVGGIGQVGNVDGLAGPAHVEVWDWRKPARRFTAGAQGHRGIINSLLFHPDRSWLIGGGGGSDGGFLAFWNLGGAADKELTGHRIKTDGHVHRIGLDPAGKRLDAAGFRKLDVWGLG
jgi:WD40 repeat protein